MRKMDINKQIDRLEESANLFVFELQNKKELTKSRFDLIDDLMIILANLQAISPQMEIDKTSKEYRRLVLISNKISWSR